MTKSAEDFYFEEYRSVPAQLFIFRVAIKADRTLPRRVGQKANPNRWERNLRTFLGTIKPFSLLTRVTDHNSNYHSHTAQ
jgi:hypothetical protein